MTKQTFDHTLQIDSDKYLITKRFYQELLAETNYIGDYAKCRQYVRLAMNKCLREIQQVTEFTTKKVDIEL